MLTLKRFSTLVGTYGADTARWPPELHEGARQLLDISPEARALLAQASELDRAIEAAGASEHAKNWPAGEEAAALARLRSGLNDRIAGSAQPVGMQQRDTRRPGGISGWLLELGLFPAEVTPGRFAIMAGVAVIVGLLIGATSFVAAPDIDTVLTVLQPEPIHMLAD